MDLENKTILVTGGSRGLGAGIVSALAGRNANVISLSRNAHIAPTGNGSDAQVKQIVGDITDRDLARRIIAEHSPDIIVLNAGAIPSTVPIDVVSWDAFSAPWDADVKGALTWTQACLTAPMRRGGVVLSVSSGAAINGSPLSGGYAGSKRMLWLMANYANSLAAERELDLLFQTVVPMQMVAATGVGDAASKAYSERMGIDPESFLERFGQPLVPRSFGEHVAQIIENLDRTVRAYGVKGDTGITNLEVETH